MKTISDIMTKKVITVSPQTPIVEAIGTLLQGGFNGLPVIDDKGFLVGVVTEYNFIISGSNIHLPTLLKLFDQLDTYKKDQYLIKNDLKQILTLTVNDVMNKEPLTLPETATFEEVIKLFKAHHRVNPIPVIDKDNRVIGVVSRFDVLRPFHVLQGILKYF